MSGARQQQQQEAVSSRGVMNTELCGEGFRDIRGVINCRGCGAKFRSGAEFGEHSKEMQHRRRVRQERSEKVVKKSRQLNTLAQMGSGDRMERGSGEGGNVREQIAERSRMAETAARPATQVSMPGTANTAPSFPGHAQHIVPVDHAPHPSMVTAVPQQLLQQQLHQQQLAFQQQQQLMILKQQQQNAPFPVMPQQQQLLPDRDRQIALLEQELKVQKMMMEVERREAIVREQARFLTVQVDRMRMDQEQVIRSQVVSPCGISSTTLDSWTKDGEAVGRREVSNGRGADGGVEVNEKLKLERMFKQMEKARKEELDKAVAAKEGTTICDKTGRRLESADQKLVDGGKCRKGDVKCEVTSSDVKVRKEAFKNNIGVKLANNGDSVEKGQSSSTKQRQEKRRVSDDVLSLNDETAKEQLKIMEEIRARNDEKRKQEEMTIKLITKLSLDEEDQLLPDSCEGAAAVNDSWPELREAATAGGETVRQKIARLKETAERRGMCLDKKNGRHNGFEIDKNKGMSVEESFLISSRQNTSEENDKLVRKMMKKNEKLKRERTKSEAMSELEMERKKAADELKERLAAQEREQFSRMVTTEGKQGEHGVNKKRNKAGK